MENVVLKVFPDTQKKANSIVKSVYSSLCSKFKMLSMDVCKQGVVPHFIAVQTYSIPDTSKGCYQRQPTPQTIKVKRIDLMIRLFTMAYLSIVTINSYTKSHGGTLIYLKKLYFILYYL